jgi:hypothetical protein
MGVSLYVICNVKNNAVAKVLLIFFSEFSVLCQEDFC